MKRSALLAALVCVAAPLPSAAGQESPQGSTPAAAAPKPVITRASWRRRPSGGDIERVYPLRAKREKVSGEVVIRCRARKDGHLERCEILRETPTGYGFGEAAIKLSTNFVMNKTTSGGTSVAGAVIMIPLRFRSPT